MSSLEIENLGRVVNETPLGRVRDGNHSSGTPKEAAGTFSEVLRDSLEKVNTHQHEADQAINELIAGRSKNIHEAMLAVERADMSLKLMMQVRNKVLDAYREIMRMQV